MSKKWLCALLALILIAALPCAALAAKGDANIARQEQISEDYNDFIMGGCVAGDALYLCGSAHIFAYRAGDAEVTAIEYQPPALAEDENWNLERLFSDGERLYALASVGRFVNESYGVERVEILPVEIDGDTARFGEAVECSVEDLTNDGSYMRQINGACCAGGYLALNGYDDAGSDFLYALDIGSGEGNFVEGVGEAIACVSPYEDGTLLIENYDYEARAIAFQICDPASGSLTPACPPVELPEGEYGGYNGLVWSAESGKLYYLSDGYVMAAEDFDFENAQPVAELSTFYGNQTCGLLLPGDLYVYSGYEATVVRATDPDALPEVRLVVCNRGWNDAVMDVYYAFGNSHSDVAVVIDDGGYASSALVESMMNRDDSVDIYILPVGEEAYDAVYNRGYMVELDDERLTSAVGEMYPAIRDALTRDGKLVAVPVSVYGWLPGLNYEGFEKLGVPREEIPDNWTELIELLGSLADKLPEDGSVRIFGGYDTQESVRNELFGAILASWRDRLTAEGGTPHYGDPELVNALDMASKLDLAALGLPSRDEEGEDGAGAMAAIGGLVAPGEEPIQLIEFNNGCTIGNYYNNGADPVPLSVAPGEEAYLPLSLTVAFVNPFSKHAELAQEFLVELMDNLDERVLYNLSDKYTEPVPNPSMMEQIEDAQQTLEDMKTQLEAAEAVDKPALEESIASQEAYIADMEKFSWTISAETIARYRAMDDKLIVSRFDFLSGESAGELETSAQQFLDGKIPAEEFLNELDRKVRMRAMEGN